LGGGAAGRRSRWANCARSRNSFFSLLNRSCLMRATMADASRFPSGPMTAFGLGGLSGLCESIVVAMVSSSGSFERLDRAGEGPRGSKPRARGFFFFGFSGEGVFASSSTFAGFRKSRAKRPGFGGLALSSLSSTTAPGVAGVLLGERGMLVVGCLPGAASPRPRRRRDVQYVLVARLAPHAGRCGLAQRSALLASVFMPLASQLWRQTFGAVGQARKFFPARRAGRGGAPATGAKPRPGGGFWTILCPICTKTRQICPGH
jgi:hypothetical protein